MQSNAVMKFELLKMLIITTPYSASITQNKESKTLFLNTLKSNKYTPEELLELINLTQDKQVKSLLITQLFSIREYLDRLNEESIIDRITNNTVHAPSRLNPLAHQLAIEQLTLEQIKELQPEAAVSILCSLPHFHLIKNEQVDALIGQFPNPKLIPYWINHYSMMPNAYFVLAHLNKLFAPHVLLAIRQMDVQKQEHLVEHVIDHLDLFNPGFKPLYEGDKEKHLIHAMEQYLNGKHHNNYIIYIHLLTEQLLNENQPLSLATIQLILSLNGMEEFKQLINKTGDLTNYYIRSQAQTGDTDLFYNDGRLNLHRMNLLIPLKRSMPIKSEDRSFLHSWLYPAKASEVQVLIDKNSVPENTLIQQLAKEGKSIKAIDYYLLHFKGNGTTVSKLIQDYLDNHAQKDCTESRRKTLYLTAILINRPELKRSVREALYTSFLLFPELYDEQIRGWLLKYDVERTIKYFGQQAGINNYKLVIEFCSEALKKLEANKDASKIKIVTQALSEAKMEVEFTEQTGFFPRLFHRFIRCWKSGWTGFFSPNLPLYVAPFYAQRTEVNSIPPRSSPKNTSGTENVKTNLSDILTEVEKTRSLNELDKLMSILNATPLTAIPQDVLSLRHRLNNLFHVLVQDSKQNKEIQSWLARNQQTFSSNQFHLLELRMCQEIRMDIDLLAKQIQEDSDYLKQSAYTTHLQTAVNELNIILPELKAEQKPPENTPQTIAEEPITLEKVTGIVTNAWNWAKGGVESFFAEPTPRSTSASSDEQTIPALSTPGC